MAEAKGNSVAWFEIYVDDMDRARAFYEAVFEVTLEVLNGPGMQMFMFPGEMDRYGANGALVKMDGMSAGGGGTMVYFGSEDCSVEEGRVVASGGTIQKTKQSIGEYGNISLVTDTEGNMIGIHSMK